jgi:protein-S-isoprenylcysteine O-methyltransferase Ste14
MAGIIFVSTVARRAFAGAAFLLLVIGLMLFVSAGSLRYWQGWVYWSIFSSAVLIVTLYFLKHDPDLVARRTSVGPVAEPETIQKIIQTLASILFCGALIVPGLDYRYRWSSVPLALVVAADLLVAGGFAIVFIVFRENSYASSLVRVEAEQRVISSGPYAHVRHPMYAGGSLLLIGTPLALGSWWGMPAALALCAVIVVRLLDEERRLTAELKGYDEYQRKVPYRLVPGVW